MAIAYEPLAHPAATRRMYVACDCNAKGCIGRHTSAALEGVPSKVCPECGDTGEAHYIMVSATSDGWPTFLSTRRGHDDDEQNDLACDGYFGKTLNETEEEFAARGGHR